MDSACKFGFKCLVLVLLVTNFAFVDALPDRVPSEACSTLSPVVAMPTLPPALPVRKRRDIDEADHTAAPQTTPPPFEIDISALAGGYLGGCSYCEYA